MKHLISKALESRGQIFEIAVVATVIALGTNLVAARLDGYFGKTAVIWMGILLIGLGLIYFLISLLKKTEFKKEFEGVILLTGETKSVTEIHGYPLSESLEECLKAAFLENDALRVSWEQVMFPEKKGNASDGKEESEAKDSPKSDVNYYAIVKSEIEETKQASVALLNEAVEFCLLKFLSLHLSTYFDNRDNDETKIAILERNDIPEVLLQNRILSLLTTSIEDRAIFIESGMHKNPPSGEIHAIYGSNGAVYERFHLTLPRKTIITRPSPGTIRLTHPRYTLTLSGKYHGFHYQLPKYFSELYLSHEDHEYHARMLHLEVTASLNPTAFLYFKDWGYYHWIDSFVDYLEEHVCFQHFLSSIDWNSTATRIRATIIQKMRLKLKTEQNRATKLEEAKAKIEGSDRETNRGPLQN